MSTTATDPVLVPIHPDLSEFETLLDQRIEGIVERAAEKLAAITITTTDENASEEMGEPVAWKSILAVEGELTRDNSPTPRILPVDSVSWSDLPIPFFAMSEIVGPGHDGQVLVGRIDTISRIPVEEFGDSDFDLTRVPPGGQVIYATGVIQNNATTQHFLTLMDDRALRGVSVDFVSARWGLAKKDTLEFVDEEKLTLDDILSGDYVLALHEGEIGGATATPMQGIGSAMISLVAAALDQIVLETGYGIFALIEPKALVAAAPLVRPKSVYFRPEPDHPQALTVDLETGEVYGHPFLWNTCHVGFQHECMMAPRSPSGYANFHLGPVPTAEGEDVYVGQITINTDHAPVGTGLTPEQVWKHYSDTGCAVADVRMIDGRFGGWLSGALRAVPEHIARTLKAAKISPDWRKREGRLDLIGLLGVNNPGYAVRPQVALVASAAGYEVEALVAAGVFADPTEIEDLAAELLDEDCEPCTELDVLAEELAAA